MPDEVRRLISCGLTEENAWDVYYKYDASGDWSGFYDFVRSCELLYDDQKEYPKEEE